MTDELGQELSQEANLIAYEMASRTVIEKMQQLAAQISEHSRERPTVAEIESFLENHPDKEHLNAHSIWQYTSVHYTR